ncbi:hypothetical protein QTP88_011449 [Uroleucon formosanum]
MCPLMIDSSAVSAGHVNTCTGPAEHVAPVTHLRLLQSIVKTVDESFFLKLVLKAILDKQIQN